MSEFVCPVCFATHRRGGTCGDCGSEAIEVDLVPMKDFLSGVTVAEMEDTAARWREATGFLETYKAAKQARIERLLKRRRALRPEPRRNT